VLQCVAVCCSVLQCAAVYCLVLPWDVVCCSVLQRVIACCCVVQCVEACCSVLQCVARPIRCRTFSLSACNQATNYRAHLWKEKWPAMRTHFWGFQVGRRIFAAVYPLPCADIPSLTNLRTHTCPTHTHYCNQGTATGVQQRFSTAILYSTLPPAPPPPSLSFSR